MARLWKSSVQVDLQIPKTVIYHVGDRLNEPGVRGAPSTMFNINNTALFFAGTADLAIPSENGLLFSSSACAISLPERVDGMLGKPSPVASGVLDLLKWGESHWFIMTSTAEQKKRPPDCQDMALYDIVAEAGRGAGFELLTETPVELSQESAPDVQFLLTTSPIQENNVSSRTLRHVGFIRQGRIRVLDEFTADFANRTLEQARVLQRDSITQEIHNSSKYGAQDSRYKDTLKRLMDKVSNMVDQLEKELAETGKIVSESGLGLMHDRRKAIFSLLSRFYRNRYLVKEREFPETQKYCLD